MTAQQIIEDIKSLDPQEQAKVRDFLLGKNGDREVVIMGDAKFDRLADRAIERHADLLQKLAQ